MKKLISVLLLCALCVSVIPDIQTASNPEANSSTEITQFANQNVSEQAQAVITSATSVVDLPETDETTSDASTGSEEIEEPALETIEIDPNASTEEIVFAILDIPAELTKDPIEIPETIIEASTEEAVNTVEPAETTPEASTEETVKTVAEETVETVEPVETTPEASTEETVEIVAEETVETVEPVETTPEVPTEETVETVVEETVETVEPVETTPEVSAEETVETVVEETVETVEPVETTPEVPAEETVVEETTEPTEEETIVDLTEKLNSFMLKNAAYLEAFKARYGYTAACLYYYLKVTDGGDWDIKLQDEWKFEKGKTYIYQGKEMRMDDPGNIHFGYLGAILFHEEFVCFGAGANNVSKFGFTAGDIHSYYDDPQDQEMMRWGYSMYEEGTLKK